MDSEYETFVEEQHIQDSDVEGDEMDLGGIDMDMDMDMDG